jgi:hypothetical protein
VNQVLKAASASAGAALQLTTYNHGQSGLSYPVTGPHK